MSRQISFRQRLAKNTAASLGTNVWTMVLTIVALPIVLHGIGAEAFGVWVFLNTFSATNGWLSIPANGLSISSTRAVATAAVDADEAVLHRSVSATCLTFATAGVGFGLLVAVAAPYIVVAALDLQDVSRGTLTILGVAFGVQVLAEHLCLAATSVLEGIQEIAAARGIDALRKTGVAVATAAAAALDGRLTAVGVAAAGSSLFVALLALILLGRSPQVSGRRPVPSEIRSIVRYGGTVSALTGTGVLHRTMDRTIVGVAFGPSSIAVVELAAQIQAGTTALLTASTYPVLATAPWLKGRGDEGALRSLLERTTRYSVLLTLPLVAAAVAFAGPFIRVWVGPEFSEAIGLTQVAVIYVAVVAPIQAGSNLLLGLGHARSVVYAAATSVLVNLAASIALVQVIGTVGVFVGTIIGSLVLVPILTRSVDAISSEHTLSLATQSVLRALPPVVAVLAIGLLVHVAGLPDAWALIVGGLASVICASAAAARWSLTREERRELLRSLRIAP